MAPHPAILEPRAAITIDDYVRDIGWAADGLTLAVAGGEGGIYLVDGSRPDALLPRKVGEHQPGALAVAWEPGGTRLASCGQDSALALWDGTSGREIKRWKPSRSWSEQLAWSPDARLLASAAGRSVALWTSAGELAQEITDHTSTVTALGWDRGGRDLGAALNGGLRVHRVENPKDGGPPRVTSRSLAVQSASLTVAFSPNGKVLASGLQDGSVHFWYLATGRNSEMRGYGARVGLTAWSANSRYLATSAGQDIVVWDFGGKGPEGSRPQQLSGHSDRIDALAWQPEGPFLVTGGRDWRLSLWQPGKAALAVDAHLADGEITVVRWSPDSRLVAVGEATGGLKLYELVGPPARTPGRP